MDTTSTINKTWSLCTLASFIGFFILVFSLNHGHDHKLNQPALQQNIAISITSENPTTSSIDLLEPVSLESEIPVNEEQVKCNIFDWKWVYDPERNPVYNASQCPFLSDKVSCQRNGRPDSAYEKWYWQPKGCNIPRFNGTDMLERLRGQRLIIVGDSLNRNQWESLACLLYSAIPSSRAHVGVWNSFYKVFKANDYNCSVEFYWSPFLVQLDTKQDNGIRVLRLDKLSPSEHKWKGADFMDFNTGHWWIHGGKLKAWNLFQHDGKLEEIEIESAFQIAMKTWAQWIDRNVDTTKTTVFFRSISPEHKGEMWCYNSTQPIMDESYSYSFAKPIKEMVERTIELIEGMKTPVGT